MYIVCFTVRMKNENLLPNEYEFHSDWKAYETLQEAEAVYNNLLNRKDLYTASICKPVQSTDYILKESKMKSCDICGKNTHEREFGWHQAVNCKPVLICWSCESEHTDEELFHIIHKEHPADKDDWLCCEECGTNFLSSNPCGDPRNEDKVVCSDCWTTIDDRLYHESVDHEAMEKAKENK